MGYEPRTKLVNALQAPGELMSVTGTVKMAEPVELRVKMLCFRCSACGTEMVVKQDQKWNQYVYPSSCRRGCPARGRFVLLLSSPYTIYQSMQMIQLQESFIDNQGLKTLNVKLVQDLVDTVVIGTVVTLTGIVRNAQDRKKKFVKRDDAKSFKSYLKCFAVDGQFDVTRDQQLLGDKNMKLISMMKAEPSPFRVLVHSLCPTIFGREEVKAGLILSLLSGSDLMKERRSESHVLLIGNPGQGKSMLLQACAEASMKGIYVSGPTTTGVGLTASVSNNGTIEAGPLVLADGGACCIDEFDKMSSYAHVLLESMEQQIISISKSGISANLPSRVVVIAAANPIGSFFDRSKTIMANVKISRQLLSRFDLIFPLEQGSRASDQQYMDHVKNVHNSGDSMFFNTPSTSSMRSFNIRRDGIGWLKKNYGEQIDLIPAPILQSVIAFSREHLHPKLSTEAKIEIREFFLHLRGLAVGDEVQPITFRQLEALMRLTMARARADLVEEATREHALDVINLFKHTLTDVFSPDEPTDPAPSAYGKKVTPNVSVLSKPKQMKAFLEHLREAVEQQQRNVFTSAEMKSMAKEVGIKDYDEIVYKLNMESYILKTAGGYKVVD